MLLLSDIWDDLDLDNFPSDVTVGDRHSQVHATRQQELEEELRRVVAEDDTSGTKAVVEMSQPCSVDLNGGQLVRQQVPEARICEDTTGNNVSAVVVPNHPFVDLVEPPSQEAGVSFVKDVPSVDPVGDDTEASGQGVHLLGITVYLPVCSFQFPCLSFVLISLSFHHFFFSAFFQ